MSVDTPSLARELREADRSGTQAAAIGRALLEGAATKAVAAVKSYAEPAKIGLRTAIEKLRSAPIMGFAGTILTLAAIIIAVAKL